MTADTRQTYYSTHTLQYGFADYQTLDGLGPVTRLGDCWVLVPFHDVRYTS